MNDRLIQDLCDLIAIPSVSGSEQQISEFVRQRCTQTGADVQADPHGNVTAIVAASSDGPILHVAGHLDTVPPADHWSADPYTPRRLNDRIIGLGSSDMKAGLAGMLHCLTYFAQQPPASLRLFFDFTICEENAPPGKRNGVYDICQRYGGDFAITAEPTGQGNGQHCPAVGSQGHLNIAITFRGRAAHSAYPELGSNAIHAAARFIQRLEHHSNNLPRKVLWPGFELVASRPCASVTTATAGVAVNVIPDRCELHVSRRTAPGETRQSVAAEIDTLLEGLGPAHYSIHGDEPACLSPPDSRLIQAARAAFARASAAFNPRLSRGRQDLVIFAAHRMEIFNVGPGSYQSGHCPDEFCRIDDLLSGTRLLQLTIEELARMV
ncbi:MAG: M20 family metallopeptidase, partial [Phycisphaerae bacterium]